MLSKQRLTKINPTKLGGGSQEMLKVQIKKVIQYFLLFERYTLISIIF